MVSTSAVLEAAPMEQEFLEPGRLDTELARSPDAGFNHPPIDAERSGSWEGCPYLARLAMQDPELAAAEARRYYDDQAAGAGAAKKDRAGEASTNEDSFWESLETDLGLNDSKPDQTLPALPPTTPPPTTLAPTAAVETMVPPHEPAPQELVRPPAPVEEVEVLPESHPLPAEIAAATTIEPAEIPLSVHRGSPGVEAEVQAEPANEPIVAAVPTGEAPAELSESSHADRPPAFGDDIALTAPSIQHAEIGPAPLQEAPAAVPLDLPAVESAPAVTLLHDTVPDALEPAPVRPFAPEVIETYLELEAILQADPQPQQLVESARHTDDSELPDLLPPAAHETDDPPEVTVVLAEVFADIPAAKEDKMEPTPDELRTILSAIAVELPACYGSPDRETTASPTHITPELTEQLLTLMRALGYEQPKQPLVGYVEKYGAERLLQVLRQLCMLYLYNDDYGKRELLAPLQSTLATDDDIYARVGRMLLTAAALLRRSVAYN